MFLKQSSCGLKAIILIVLSLVLFFCDYRYQLFDGFRSKASYINLSIQRAVFWPVELAHSIKSDFIKKHALIEENKRLVSEMLLINAELQRLEFLEYENNQLRSLLYGAKQFSGKPLFAELIRSDVDKFGQTATINKGRLDGVYVGQSVLDHLGLLGQIILVKDRSSQILLITSSKSAVPVMVARNGLQTIALGKGKSDRLELVNVSKTSDLKVGDSLVTSGLGQVFPAGYYVGTVSDIKHMVGERFVKAFIAPKSHINSRLHVLLVTKEGR